MFCLVVFSAVCTGNTYVRSVDNGKQDKNSAWVNMDELVLMLEIRTVFLKNYYEKSQILRFSKLIRRILLCLLLQDEIIFQACIFMLNFFSGGWGGVSYSKP